MTYSSVSMKDHAEKAEGDKQEANVRMGCTYSAGSDRNDVVRVNPQENSLCQ